MRKRISLTKGVAEPCQNTAASEIERSRVEHSNVGDGSGEGSRKSKSWLAEPQLSQPAPSPPARPKSTVQETRPTSRKKHPLPLHDVHTTAAMMSQSLRASRSLLTRVSRQQVSVARRTFLTSAARQADPVQDLYLRELRAYKPAPIKPGDAEAHVQKFSAPKPPPSPEEANIANELKDYEAQQVEVEGQAAAGEAAPVEESWFEEDEEPAAAAH
ncbi:hypothetical protein DTO166G4_4892 [Paecilomyces variotii]|nr:hypothetical protein DTO166G4_4892 [Paecilomyces variotii]KAJ9233567.1 hypothetical protein DTO166G5_5690 [Paecilomyces variotii]